MQPYPPSPSRCAKRRHPSSHLDLDFDLDLDLDLDLDWPLEASGLKVFPVDLSADKPLAVPFPSQGHTDPYTEPYMDPAVPLPSQGPGEMIMIRLSG